MEVYSSWLRGSSAKGIGCNRCVGSNPTTSVCGMEKWLSRHSVTVKIVGSNPAGGVLIEKQERSAKDTRLSDQ